MFALCLASPHYDEANKVHLSLPGRRTVHPHGKAVLTIASEKGNNHARSTSSESGCKAGLTVVV